MELEGTLTFRLEDRMLLLLPYVSREALEQGFESDGEEKASENFQKVEVHFDNLGEEDNGHVPLFLWWKLWYSLGLDFL